MSKCTFDESKIESFPKLNNCINSELQKNLNLQELFGKCHQEADEVLGEMKKKYLFLGTGDFRNVFKLNKDCIVKIPANAAGAQSNLLEDDAWHIIKRTKNKKIIRHFVPVISTTRNGSHLIMAKVLTNAETTQSHEELESDKQFLFKTLEEHKIRCMDIVTDNIGYTKKGRPIIFDYGYGIQCKIGNNWI